MKTLVTSFLVFLVLLCTALILAGIKKDDNYYARLTEKINQHLRNKETEARREMAFALDQVKQGKLENFLESSAYHPGSEISTFIYRNDSLIAWNNSGIPMPLYLFDEGFVFEAFKLKNGWYRLLKIRDNEWLAVSLILIKREYGIQNKYLISGFPDNYKIDEKAELSAEKGVYPLEITDEDGDFLLGIQFKGQAEQSRRFPWAAGTFYLLSVVALIFLIYSLRLIPFFKKYKLLHIGLFAAIALVGRYYMITEKFPKVIYNLPLFNPEYFASSTWLPSLGDFIFNTVLVTLLLGLIFQRFLKLRFLQSNYPLARIVFLLVSGSFTAFISLLINSLFGKLIIDSRISFNLLNLPELDIYSFLGFLLITILLLNFLIITHFFSRLMVRSRNFRAWEIIVFSLIPFLTIYITSALHKDPDPAQLIFPLTIYMLVAFINFRKPKEITFYNLAPVIFLFTIYATYLLFKFNNYKEVEHRKASAIRISEQQDHVAEYLFLNVEDLLRTDPVVLKYLFENDDRYPYEFFLRIAQNYFSGYWSKYALVITPFHKEQVELLNDPAYAGNMDPDLVYYENSINQYGRPTSSDNLFFIDNNTGKVNYIGRIEVNNPDSSGKKIIYIEFISKVITQVAGFPELLLDKSIKRPVDLSGYSYAVYKSGNLNISGGDYIYPLHTDEFDSDNKEFSFIVKNKFNHLAYHSGDKLILISKRVNNWQDFLNPFAYLLIFFVSILALYFLLQYLFRPEKKSLRLSFKTRIQLSILMILVASLVVIGIGIYFYIIDQFNRKNQLNITEKVNSILNELDETYNQPGRSEKPDLNYLLQQLSNIFFTDINIYDTKGYLMATSRESIYNEGVVARVMNPQAYSRMSIGRQPSFIQMEKIAAFEYLSAYAAIRGPDGNIVGYLNLPYFLRQKEVREELSSSLLALLNIYSLLIALSMIVTFVIANRLTVPLELLQVKLGQIRLGKKNEIIDYRANDEIGGLVAEYNRMIRELEKSAELLARSERESAWKEMARQVAHEVKNPLTPMKLSVQYLLKAWEDQKPDFGERMRKFHASMVEQIETLSVIASEFSYFAKMPQAVKIEVDLLEVLENCLEFFRNNESGTKIFFDKGNLSQAIIMAERDQMVRIFNNLLRNAIQAIPEDRQGQIQVSVDRQSNFYIVKVKDNGTGIPEDVRDKIFSPSFTTKNSGMGLGLSMAKTIAENSGGEIYFETYENQGTTFFVKLPVIVK